MVVAAAVVMVVSAADLNVVGQTGHPRGATTVRNRRSAGRRPGAASLHRFGQVAEAEQDGQHDDGEGVREGGDQAQQRTLAHRAALAHGRPPPGSCRGRASGHGPPRTARQQQHTPTPRLELSIPLRSDGSAVFFLGFALGRDFGWFHFGPGGSADAAFRPSPALGSPLPELGRGFATAPSSGRSGSAGSTRSGGRAGL